MPQFLITLHRVSHEYADVTVEAKDSDAAELLAINRADADEYGTWEPIDMVATGLPVVSVLDSRELPA